MPRPIDADALLNEINELKKSPWYNGGNGNYERLVRSDAIGIVVDLCIKQAPILDYAPRQQWISVKDRLPGDMGKSVLVVNGHGKISIYALWKREYGNKWTWIDSAGRFNHVNDITHWMPLPEPPKEEV